MVTVNNFNRKSEVEKLRDTQGVEVRDVVDNLDQYTPGENDLFRTTDTDELYRGDGSEWVKTDFGSFDSAQQYYVSPKGDDSENSGRSPEDSFASISRAVEQIRADRGPSRDPEPASITVESGEYTVDNPVRVPQKVSISGEDLRSCQLYPQNPKLDYFHCDSMQYFYGLRFYDHQSPSWCFSFPRAIIEATINNSGELSNVDVLYSPTGYFEGSNDSQPVAVIDPPRNGTQAEIDLTVNNGEITGATITNSGSGYETEPTISVPAPENDQPFVTASPYPLNCSSITGPFDENGNEIPADAPLPYDTSGFTYTDPVDGSQTTYAAVDKEGAGGGILVDGRLCYGRNVMSEVTATSNIPQSPLNSFVTAQFTQVNQGGPGHAVINGGFAQFVSSFTTFCTYGFKTKTGGSALISNSVSDFGTEGLVAEGRALNAYTSGDVTQDKRSGVAKIKINSGGSGYSNPTIDISGTATATATVKSGSITDVTVTDSGDDYTSTPTVTVSGSGTGADLEAEMDKVGQFTIENLDTFTQPGGDTITATPRLTSVVDIAGESVEPTVTQWTDNNDGTYTVSISPAIDAIDSTESVDLFEKSVVNSGGHLFEYPGTGVTYNALPEYGGRTNYSQMVKQFGSGRVYHTSSDERGNFYVGDQFKVNQSTGTVTLNTDEFNLSGLNAVGPFSVDGVSRGVQLREVADRDDMVSNSGLDGNAAPTVRAVRNYVQGEVNPLETDVSSLQSNVATKSDEGHDHTGTDEVQIPDAALVEDYLTSAPSSLDVTNSGTNVATDVSGIDFDKNINASADGDGTVTVTGSSSTDTTIDVSDGGSTIVSQVTDINFSSNVSVTDDGDGTVSVSATSSGFTEQEVEDIVFALLETNSNLFWNYNGTDTLTISLKDSISTNSISNDDYNESVQTITSASGTVDLDLSVANTFRVEAIDNVTFTFSNVTSTPAGNSITVYVDEADGAGPYTLSWPTSVVWNGGSAVAEVAQSGNIEISLLTDNGGTEWRGRKSGGGFA